MISKPGIEAQGPATGTDLRSRAAAWRRRAFGAVVALALGATGCGESAPPPNILLVIMDTTRADILGCYGGRAATPNLSALAGRGVRFDDVSAHNPFTLGSVATLLTSLGPDLHGIKYQSGFLLDDRAVTLAEVFRDAGYTTAAFVSAVPLRSETGIAQGFETYDDDLSMPFPVYRAQLTPVQGSLKGAQRRGDETVRRAAQWLRGSRVPDRPFFLTVHLFDPHEPYDPPPPFQAEYADNLYAGEVAFTDALIGELVAELTAGGLIENTVVCVVADHGESFGEHDEVGHGTFLYDATLHVPWIVAGPGVPHARVEGLTGLVDVAPTLLACAGIAAPPSFEGQNVLSSFEPSALAGAATLPSRALYAETYYMRVAHGWSEVLAWREDQWKYVMGITPELYDTARDPQETTNLVAVETDRAEAMARALALYLRRPSEHRLRAETDAPDVANAERLGSLGYVGGTPDPRGLTEPGWELGLPDPKIEVHGWNQRQQAQAAYRVASSHLEVGAFDEALRWSERSLELDPKKLDAHKLRGQVLIALDRAEEARRLFRSQLDAYPEDADLWCGLAMAHDRAGEVTAARDGYGRALALDPGHPRANLFRGYQLVREQDYAGSLPYYERAFVADPANTSIGLELARVHLQLNDRVSARRVLQETLRHDPTDPDALLTLAQVCQDLEDPFGARQAMEVFLQLHPNRPEAPRVARALQRLGS